MIDYLGSIGAILLLVAYFMVTTKRWAPVSWSYQGTNIIAATLLIIYSIEKSAHVNVALNSVFVAIGCIGVYKIIKRSSKKSA